MSRLPDQSLFLFYESDEEDKGSEPKGKESTESPSADVKQTSIDDRSITTTESFTSDKEGWEAQANEGVLSSKRDVRRKQARRHGMELSDEEDASLPGTFDLSPQQQTNRDILSEASLPPPDLIPSRSSLRAGDVEKMKAKERSASKERVKDILDGLSDGESDDEDDDDILEVRNEDPKKATSSAVTQSLSKQNTPVRTPQQQSVPKPDNIMESASKTGTAHATKQSAFSDSSDDGSDHEELGSESPLIELRGPSFELAGSTDIDDDMDDLELPQPDVEMADRHATELSINERDGVSTSVRPQPMQEKEIKIPVENRRRKKSKVVREELDGFEDLDKTVRKRKRSKEDTENVVHAPATKKRKRAPKSKPIEDEVELLRESEGEEASPTRARSQRSRKPSRKAKDMEIDSEEESSEEAKVPRKRKRKSLDSRELSCTRGGDEQECGDDSGAVEEQSLVNPFSEDLLERIKEMDIDKGLLKGFTFLFTSLELYEVARGGALPKSCGVKELDLKEQLMKLVTLHGGKVASQFVPTGTRAHHYKPHRKHKNLCATVLLCPEKPNRTEKLLMALLHGTACLRFEWLVDCCTSQEVINYLDKGVKKQYHAPLGFSVELQRDVYGYEEAHTAVRQPPDVFVGARCEVVGSKGFVGFWSRMLKAAGAKVVKRLGEPWATDGRGLEVVVSDPHPTKYLEDQTSALRIPTLSANWVMECLLARKVVPFLKGSPAKESHHQYFEIPPPRRVRNFLEDLDDTDEKSNEK